MIKLVRTKAGKFEVNKTVQLEDIETKEQVEENLIYPLEYLNFPKYELNEQEKDKVSHGMSIQTNLANGTAILTHKNKLIAMVSVENRIAKASKVFI